MRPLIPPMRPRFTPALIPNLVWELSTPPVLRVYCIRGAIQGLIERPGVGMLSAMPRQTGDLRPRRDGNEGCGSECDSESTTHDASEVVDRKENFTGGPQATAAPPVKSIQLRFSAARRS